MTTFWTWDLVESLARHRVVESPSLELKRELDLGSRNSRIEALKDLTGIGNGGGGSIVYGMVENDDGTAARVAPMSDRKLMGILEDIVRSGIRPPLLADFRALDDPGSEGFVLVVDVQRSPLGPYMVEAYDQTRYFIRLGSRTAPMSEQQVRDAYAIAARAREHRAEVWASHRLPFDPGTTAVPWLVLSGLPEGPLDEVFDPADYLMETFQPAHTQRTSLGAYMNLADLNLATSQLRIWADGIAGDHGYNDRQPTSVMRLHRDGAAVVAHELNEVINTWNVPRALNGQLAYLADVWREISLRGPVELDARLVNLGVARAEAIGWRARSRERAAYEPFQGPTPTVSLQTERVAYELLIPRLRHGIVHQFAHRLEQAFGRTRAVHMFEAGKLYGRSGNIGLSYSGAGIWSNERGNRAAGVDEAGAISNDDGNVIAFVVDGVVLDLEGRALAACELATGSALPDDFAPEIVESDPRAIVVGRDSGIPGPATHGMVPPAPLREWSSADLDSLIKT
jgi:Putative DNA-binding domain